MQPEEILNLSLFGPDMHPCFKVDHFANIVKNTPSNICVLLCIFLALLSAITICGNILVIISIIYFKQLHTPTNYLIVSLAVTDLLIGMMNFPFSTAFPQIRCGDYDHYDHWTGFCMIRRQTDVSLTTCSILSLGCISIDRYYAVCHPLTYRAKMSRHVVAIMILMSWGFAAIIVIADLVNLNYIDELCYGYCLLFFGFVVSFCSFFLPLIIFTCIICIYLKIFLVAQRQVRSIQNTTCQSTKFGATVNKMERKATKTLAIVLGVYLLCWSPYFLNNLINLITFKLITPLQIRETLIWIKLSNSMLNPFIYAFFYSWFRSAFRMIISGKIFQSDFTNSQLH